jgi:hypothetical protein
MPARTERTDAFEEGFEVLRRRFGGIGRSQRIEQWVGLRDVDLDPIQPRQILVRENDPLTGGPHERSGGARPGGVRQLAIEPVDAVMLHQPQPCRLHGIFPSQPRFSSFAFNFAPSCLLC